MRPGSPLRAVWLPALFLLSSGLLAAEARAAEDTCLECHAMNDEERLVAPTRGWKRDIHFERGLTCASCHGGDATDQDVSAMEPSKGFRGAVRRGDVAAMCARCHADAAYMKRFNPRPYIFSLDEWKTSVHCKRESEGDGKVATCTNCHGVHGIRPHTDPASPVYARNVPGTCAKCHNSDYMKGRTVPTDQYALYTKSVHGVALLEKGDVSAPACNDCHGNHGAAPPGVKDITHVCATCHGREGELFGASRMKAAMDRAGKKGCISCHGNHGIQRPAAGLLSAAPGGACAECHEKGSAAERHTLGIIAGFGGLEGSVRLADSLLVVAEKRGMETTFGRAALKEAQDQYVGARALLHSFDPKVIGAAIEGGQASAKNAAEEGRKAIRNWTERRYGTAASLGVILLMIGLLIAKIRQIERPPGDETRG